MCLDLPIYLKDEENMIVRNVRTPDTKTASDTPHDSYLQQTDVRTSRLTTDCSLIVPQALKRDQNYP